MLVYLKNILILLVLNCLLGCSWFVADHIEVYKGMTREEFIQAHSHRCYHRPDRDWVDSTGTEYIIYVDAYSGRFQNGRLVYWVVSQ